ncbi:MAG: SdrD B-like domain-containing protein [Candidatus Margulisiibacteriota bacterium]
MAKRVLIIICAVIMAVFIASAVFAAESNVELSLNASRVFDNASNVSRAISANQDVALVEVESTSRFKITGVGLGTTYVYVWWSDDSYSVFKVSVKNLMRSKQAELLKAVSQDGKNMRFELSGSSYGGQSESQYSSNRWAYGGFFSGLKISGDTPLGRTDSYVNYEGYNASHGLTAFSLNFKGENYYVDAGDGTISFSETTLPYLHYQGIQLRRDFSDQMSLTFVAGARGQGYWGKDALRDTRPTQKFSALQATYKPVKELSLDFRAVTSSTEGISAKSDIIGVGAKYSPVHWFSLAGEVSKSMDDSAWKTEATYNDRGLSLKGIYKNIPADFVTPHDSLDSRGVEGFFFYGSHNPFSFIRWSAQASRYKNSYTQAVGSDIYNSDVSGNIDLSVNRNLTLTYAPWQNDHRGFDGGGLGQGALAQASYAFKLLGFSNIFFRYQPSKFTNSSTGETDYMSDRTTVGTRLGFTDALYLDLASEWNSKTTIGSAVAREGKMIRAILNYDSRIGKTPFYSAVRASYYNGTDAGSPVTELWADAELSYKPSADTKFYIKGKTADYAGSSSNPIDRTEKHITCGFNAVLDSGLSFAASGRAEGFVFIDKNGNGTKDRGEEGVSGARVFVKGKNFVVTDQSGWYSIKSLEAGQTQIALDMTSVDSRNILTSPSPADIRISSSAGSRADFGLRMVSSLKGRVFAEDKAVPNFPVYVNGKKYLTDFEGKFFVYDIEPGRNTVSVEPKDLPAKMLPQVPINSSVDVEAGGTAEFNIPLKFTKEIKSRPAAQKKQAVKNRKKSRSTPTHRP